MTPDFDWSCARVFLAVLDAGSFTAAARALGSSQPTIGRHVSTLEEQLGAKLFDRAGAKLRPTPLALELAASVRAMERAAHQVALSAAGRAAELEGMVRITAGEALCVYLLPPIVRALRRAHPSIQIELIAASDIHDLGRRDADIAIRNVRPEEPELIARKLRTMRARMYATPSYLRQIGEPTTIDELRAADFISFTPREAYLAGLRRLGLPFGEAELPVIAGSDLVHLALAHHDVGVCLLFEEIGDAHPRLVRVLEELLPPFSAPLWLVCHEELRTSARYRVVFDLLAEALSGPLEIATLG